MLDLIDIRILGASGLLLFLFYIFYDLDEEFEGINGKSIKKSCLTLIYMASLISLPLLIWIALPLFSWNIDNFKNFRWGRLTIVGLFLWISMPPLCIRIVGRKKWVYLCLFLSIVIQVFWGMLWALDVDLHRSIDAASSLSIYKSLLALQVCLIAVYYWSFYWNYGIQKIE